MKHEKAAVIPVLTRNGEIERNFFYREIVETFEQIGDKEWEPVQGPLLWSGMRTIATYRTPLAPILGVFAHYGVAGGLSLHNLAMILELSPRDMERLVCRSSGKVTAAEIAVAFRYWADRPVLFLSPIAWVVDIVHRAAGYATTHFT